MLKMLKIIDGINKVNAWYKLFLLIRIAYVTNHQSKSTDVWIVIFEAQVSNMFHSVFWLKFLIGYIYIDN